MLQKETDIDLIINKKILRRCTEALGCNINKDRMRGIQVFLIRHGERELESLVRVRAEVDMALTAIADRRLVSVQRVEELS